MTALRAPLLLLALAACERTAPDTPPADQSDPPPVTRPVVRSCPAATRPVPVSFEPRLTVGDRDGITWLYGHTAQGPALAHLGVDDRLVLTPVALPDATAGALAGATLWLYAADPAPRWLPVDLTDPERPVPGEVAALTTGAASGRPFAFAVGARRALALVGKPTQLDLVLLDTATRASVAPPEPLALTYNPLLAACGDDGCFVVALDQALEGDVANHLVVHRVLPDGSREQERLASDPLGPPRAARHGDRVLVAWRTADGLRLRALDRDGRPLAAAVPVPWDSQNIDDLRLFPAADALVLAVRERDRWSVAHVGPHGNPGPRRDLPGAGGRRLYAAPLPDGLVWLALADAIDHAAPGAGVMTDAWQVEALGGFLPTAGDPTPPTRLPTDSPGDPTPYLLTRPGAAAALLTARGDAGVTNSFALLRATCPPAGAPARPPADSPAAGPDEACREDPR